MFACFPNPTCRGSGPDEALDRGVLGFGPGMIQWDSQGRNEMKKKRVSVEFEIDPLVIVLPSPKGAGAFGLQRPRDADHVRELTVWPSVPLSEALLQSYDSDAHFQALTFPEAPGWPRLTIAGVKNLLRDPEQPSPLKQITVLDYDNPDHRPWPRGDLERGHAWISQLPCHLAPTFWHSSRGGTHLIYTHETIGPEEGPALARGLGRLVSEASGKQVDASTHDYCRLFRLGNVVRDGERLTQIYGGTGKALDLSRVEPLEKAGTSVPTETSEEPSFMDPGVQAGADPGSPWRKKAAKLISHTPWGSDVQEGKSLDPNDHVTVPLAGRAFKSDRNVRLFQAMTSAVGLLFGKIGTTREHLYGLFYATCEVSKRPEDDPGRDDLHTTSWRLIETYFAEEERKAEAQAEEVQRSRDVLAKTLPPGEDPMRWGIVSAGGRYYVMQDSGLYGLQGVRKEALATLTRGKIWEGAPYEVWTENSKGEPAHKSEQQLIREYASSCLDEIHYKPGPAGGWVEQEPGGHRFCLGTFQLRDLEPAFHPECDEWFQAFAGIHYRDLGLRVGSVLAYDLQKSTCAISLAAPRRTGKSLLVRGIDECFTGPVVADKHALDDWQDQLIRALVINVNEDWSARTRRPDALIRDMIGDTKITLKRKHRDTALSHVNYRVIFTANDAKLVAGLVRPDRKHSSSDHGAIAERIYHLDLSSEGQVWTDARGGGTYVERAFFGPDKALARYFLWWRDEFLRARAEDPEMQRTRLLMPGNLTPERIRQLEVTGADDKLENDHDLMGEILGLLICRPPSGSTLPSGCRAKQDKGGRWCVNLPEVTAAWREVYDDKRASQRKICDLLRRWSLYDSSRIVQIGGKRLRRWVLDTKALEAAGHFPEKSQVEA